MKTRWSVMVLMVGMIFWSSPGRGAEPVDFSDLIEGASKSLVLVEYTFRNENASREEVGQGIVLNKEGVVLVSGTLIPEGLPKEWIKDLKIRLPGKQFTTVGATFLGRTKDRLFVYVKGEKALDAQPLDVSKTAEAKTGEQVVAVGMYDKAGGYEIYTGLSRVRAALHMVHDLEMVQVFGLTRGNSPVFDMDTGALVGITFPPVGETMTVSSDGVGAARISLRDEDQSGLFLPISEVKEALTDVPLKAFESPRSWLGVDAAGLTGIEEDARDLYHIQQPAGVTIGSVISGQPADKAGLMSKDVVLSVDGKEFSQSTVPEYMVSHFQRVLEKTAPGQKITLGILRLMPDNTTKKMDIVVTMEESPKLGSQMANVFNAKVGITTRDVVFGDTYARKLPADQKGVMVSLVKKGAPAGLGSTPLMTGYLITRVNDQEVVGEKQFEDLLKAALAAENGEEKKEVVFRVIRPDGETQVCRIDLTK